MNSNITLKYWRLCFILPRPLFSIGFNKTTVRSNIITVLGNFVGLVFHLAVPDNTCAVSIVSVTTSKQLTAVDESSRRTVDHKPIRDHFFKRHRHCSDTIKTLEAVYSCNYQPQPVPCANTPLSHTVCARSSLSGRSVVVNFASDTRYGFGFMGA